MTPAWVVVTGDFWPGAGQGGANYAVVRHLAGRGGARVHVVGHHIDPQLARHPSVVPHRVRRPFGAHLLGQPLLARAGRAVARRVIREFPDARVVVSGGNCRWTDVNWVHMVHAAWSARDEHAPAWRRLKDQAVQTVDRRAERSAVPGSRLIIANSQRTRRDLIELLRLDPQRIRVVPLGTDPDAFRPVTLDERAAARR